MIRLSSHVHWDIVISFKQRAAGPEVLSLREWSLSVGTDRGANRDGKHRPPVEAGVLRTIGKLQETCGWLYGKNSG